MCFSRVSCDKISKMRSPEEFVAQDVTSAALLCKQDLNLVYKTKKNFNLPHSLHKIKESGGFLCVTRCFNAGVAVFYSI